MTKLDRAALAYKLTQLKLGTRYDKPCPAIRPVLSAEERDLIVVALREGILREQLAENSWDDIWDDYCAEVPENRRSPQGAMAFAFDRLTYVQGKT